MDDLAPLRLMGPAEAHTRTSLIWCFTMGDVGYCTNSLVFWPRRRTYSAQNTVVITNGMGATITWPDVSPETLIDLLPEEEKAKAIAASLGVYPWKNETG